MGYCLWEAVILAEMESGLVGRRNSLIVIALVALVKTNVVRIVSER